MDDDYKMYKLTKVNTSGMSGENVECGHLICNEKSTLRLESVLKNSSDYTFQIKVKSNITSNIIVNIDGIERTIESLESWQHAILKYSEVTNTPRYIEITFSSGEYWFYNAKLETGTIPTDWSPGSEDFTDQILAVESKITQMVDEVKTEVINARGDKSTLSVRIDAIESSVRDANGNISSVSQKADSIEMKVTNMNVGGRNYILNSRFQKLENTNFMNFSGETVSIGSTTYATQDSEREVVLDCIENIIYKEGLTLILSFEYYIDSINSVADGAFIGVELQFVDSAGTSTSQEFPIPNLQGTNQWCRYVGQLTNVDPSTKSIYVHFIKGSSDGKLKYKHPKLEIGDKVTDYSLAPEDLISSIEDVQNNVDKNYEQSVADLKVLQDRIDSIVVTDESGSQVIQTADGVRWNLTQMQQGINNALDSAATANENAENAQTSADQLKDQVNDISQKTAYMEIVQQEDGNPCLELGSLDNDFKVRLTNTSLGFYQGTLRVAYISNQALYIETAIIKSSLQFGETAGFVWKLRENGNFGLQPF